MKGFDARDPAPVTASKQEMVEMGRSDISAWVANLKANPDGVLCVGKMALPYNLFRAEDLMKLYDPDGKTKLTTNGMSRELTRHGFTKLGLCATPSGKQCRLWLARDNAQMQKLSTGELGKLYETERAKKYT